MVGEVVRSWCEEEMVRRDHSPLSPSSPTWSSAGLGGRWPRAHRHPREGAHSCGQGGCRYHWTDLTCASVAEPSDMVGALAVHLYVAQNINRARILPHTQHGTISSYCTVCARSTSFSAKPASDFSHLKGCLRTKFS